VTDIEKPWNLWE